MAATSASFKHQMQQIARRWPEDPFRPNVQLKVFLASLAEHPNLTPAAVRNMRALEQDEFKKKVSICGHCTSGIERNALLVSPEHGNSEAAVILWLGGSMLQKGQRRLVCLRPTPLRLLVPCIDWPSVHAERIRAVGVQCSVRCLPSHLVGSCLTQLVADGYQ